MTATPQATFVTHGGPYHRAEAALDTVGVVKRLVSDTETVAANRRWWDADAEDYLAGHGDYLGRVDFLWCPEGLRESDAGLLGEVAGRRRHDG